MPGVRALGAGTERPRAIAVGIGGAGCNTLRAISPTAGLDLLAINDLPHPSMLGIRRRVFLARAGLSEIARMDEHAVRTLATTAEQALALELGDADFVIPFAGLGGDMGSWGSSLVARVGALKGATTLAVVTTPFSAEGPSRRAVASEALRLLRRHAHGALVLPNDRLLQVAPHVPFLKAFELTSRLSSQFVHDLLRVVTRDDLPVLKSVLRGAEDWRSGVGQGNRHHPERTAVERAFASPWIARPSESAREVILFLGIPEPDEKASQEILYEVNLRTPRASVLWGAFATQPEEFRVTLLLGF